MKNQFRFIAAAVALMTVASGCSTAPKTQGARDNLRADSQSSLARFERSDDSLQGLIDRSAGYVVFPSVGKGGFIAGGAYGKGVVYHRGAPVGFADMTEATFGLQIGGQDFAELIVFQDDEALGKFQSKGGYGLSVEASAVALKPGAAAQAEFKRGVVVFTLINGGLMGEAAVAGQKFRYRTLDEADLDRVNADTATERRAAERSEVEGNKRSVTNISGGASASSPDGDKSVGGQTKATGNASVSTPDGEHGVTTEKTTREENKNK